MRYIQIFNRVILQYAGDDTVQEVAIDGSKTYTLTGDNWDKTINPRFMTMDHGRQSLHYFHSYAALDRIDFSNLSVCDPLKDLSKLPLSVYLPDSVNCITLRDNYAILMSRIVTEEIEYFKGLFGNCVDLHISHEYSAQMKEQSKFAVCILKTV